MQLTPGTQLASTCCTTRLVVVRSAGEAVELTCGGHPMVPVDQAGAPTIQPVSGLDHGTQMGKRYQAPEVELELLCTRAGDGTLAVDGEVLETKQAKAVPASD